MEFLAVKPCKYDAYEAVPKGKVSLDLDDCESKLRRNGYEVLTNPGVMLVVRKGVEVTVYPHGRLLIHPVKERDEALRLARELYDALGK
jgi:TATA-box binding protein (TBP) (component of TFIID and TFIIIB)